MPKNDRPKKTITVTLSWFSSGPIFKDTLDAVTAELRNERVLTVPARAELKHILLLNGGQPFAGETHYGPHTTIRFEAVSLAQAVSVADTLQVLLCHEFPNGMGKETSGVYVRFAGKPLSEVLDALETALANAQRDLQGTRRFLPSKNIRALRNTFEALYA